ncbi:hypothetical protein [Streptomyces sp. NPDC049040]|uniref:hypothetical protein n=1 Tax=Streptomyces sp. NPDC049040 TaxID=3365593 RepID=UPI00371D4401
MRDDSPYAEPGTLLGQLQRGRGLGALRASAAPGAADLVHACVIGDHRWDRTTEQRDSYLARLIHRLDLSPAPIESHLFGSGGDGDAEEIELALHVLALLPLTGRFDAVPVLRRYATEGRHWTSAVEAIEWTGVREMPGIWAGLDADVVAAHSDEELAAGVVGAWEPWTSWARTQPRIRHVLEADAARRTRDLGGKAAGRATPPRPGPSPDDCTDTGSSVLVERVRQAGGPGRRQALVELGSRGEPVLLDLAEDPGLRNAAGWAPGMPQALRHLGKAAVPRARAWTASGDTTLNALGVGVLAGFGDRDDGRHLLEALTAAATAGDWCAMETPARGLGRLRVAEATGALVGAWETTVHSAARGAVLQGLLGCAPEAAEGFAVEALDDCEPDVQRQACAVVPDTARVRGRLRSLGDDPLAPEVHDAARLRLDRFAVPESG